MKLFVFYHDDGCEFAGITAIIQAESEEMARMNLALHNFDAYTKEAVNSPPPPSPWHVPTLTYPEWQEKYVKDRWQGGPLGKLIHVFDVAPNDNPIIIP